MDFGFAALPHLFLAAVVGVGRLSWVAGQVLLSSLESFSLEKVLLHS